MKRFAACFFVVMGLVLTVRAEADQKSYVWTTEYLTLPKGGIEVEYWLTTNTTDIHRAGDTAYEHQIEVEYGVTDHWDVSMYQILGKDAGESLRYKGLKFETRYRFGERGKYFVDPLLYVEYRIGAGGAQNTIEGKLVLAKDFDKLNVAYNQIIETGLRKGSRAEHEYAAGISYLVHPAVRLGIEARGSYTEKEHAIGPAVSWVSGRFWATLGAVFGLNRTTDDMQARFVIGMPF